MSSRIIIKNLPKKITEEKLRQLFCEKGTITDVQLKYTPEGKFRQFAFIGYQNEDDAEEAIKHFDKMFIQTNKIRVESCALLGDSNKPKSWSKYASDSTAYKQSHPSEDKNEEVEQAEEESIDDTTKLLSKYKDDPLFEEYLQVHAPHESEKLKKIPKHVDEEEQEDSAIESEEKEEEAEDEDENDDTEKIANKEISDLEYMKELMNKEKTPRVKKKKEPKNIELFTVKLKNLSCNCKKKHIKQFFKPLTPFTIRFPPKIRGIAYVGFRKEKELDKALLKDRSFIDGRQVSVMKYIKNDEQNTQNTTANTQKNPKWKSQAESLKNEEDIAESGRIFVRNLSYTTTENDIESLFSKFGPVSEISLPIDPNSRKIKGFGVVTFLLPEHAVKAYAELDGSILHGRMLHLLPGKNKDTPEGENLEESSNFKAKKTAKLKEQAGSSHNWNSLFLGHDAVADVIADSLGTTKERVLGDSSAAVRLALGETQIVAQTRKYLESEGVILDAFSGANTKRSKNIILVKNLPSRTEPVEIKNLFAKFGVLGRVLIPPSGITAIVEFIEPSEAKKAFGRLAYSKFKDSPLYLEWAPENSLTEKQPNSEENKETVKEEKEEEEVKEGTNEEQEEEETEEPEPDTTLFVKNLNFKTDDEALKKHFASCGKIAYATIATKKDIANPQNKLSMGYGFVRFIRKESADRALKTLQQSVLDGKSLELKRSERTLSNETGPAKKTTKRRKQTGSKILVRNVPFQATRKEIHELFVVFGEIRALRLPRKMTMESSSHRGFAFVDFTTSSDAKKAFEALSQSTHLYGRRLVLEWASEDEDVQELRKRTANQFGGEQETKRSKKSVFNIE